MAEVLIRFTHPIRDGADVFHAQACGAAMSDGRWTAWIEFIPIVGRRPLRSPRETTQPNRTDAEYWATGLTPVYLKGALQRARNPKIRRRIRHANPVFSAPATDRTDDELRPADAVLDPLSIYRKSEELLRRRLSALSPWHLVNIIRTYGLSEKPITVLRRWPASVLIATIVVGCQRLSGRLF